MASESRLGKHYEVSQLIAGLGRDHDAGMHVQHTHHNQQPPRGSVERTGHRHNRPIPLACHSNRHCRASDRQRTAINTPFRRSTKGGTKYRTGPQPRGTRIPSSRARASTFVPLIGKWASLEGRILEPLKAKR